MTRPIDHREQQQRPKTTPPPPAPPMSKGMPPPAQRYYIAEKRGPFAKGNGNVSRTKSRVEVGGTPFGMPRWEPAVNKPSAELEKRLKKVEVMLGYTEGHASPLRPYRRPRGDKQALLPHWMVVAPAQNRPGGNIVHRRA